MIWYLLQNNNKWFWNKTQNYTKTHYIYTSLNFTIYKEIMNEYYIDTLKQRREIFEKNKKQRDYMIKMFDKYKYMFNNDYNKEEEEELFYDEIIPETK